jgi:hypothetical protein
VLERLRALSRLPKPSIVNLRANGAARSKPEETSLYDTYLSEDYLSPQAFACNLVVCMKNDLKLSDKGLLKLIPRKLAPWQALWEVLLCSVKFTVAGADFALDFKQRLRDDPTPLQTITAAYLKLAEEAKERRKPDDPWPVIIIDEANALSEWEDKKSLLALLKFFVFLTKEKQLAHGESGRLTESFTRAWRLMPFLAVILATSDTFLLQWLEKGASACNSLLHDMLTRLLLQGRSRRPSATHTPWATCRVKRLARSSSTTSSRPKRRLARARRGTACTRCAAATPVHCATAP